MPIELGLHPQIQTKEELQALVAQANAENKRAIVVWGANGKVVKVVEKQNRLLEFFRRATGQTGREELKLGEYLASLVSLQDHHAQQEHVADALHEAIFPQASSTPSANIEQVTEIKTEPLVPTPPAQAQAQPTEDRTDTQQENPALYAKDPPFGTGGIVNGHYVQRQFGSCCFAHALSSYHGKAVFQTRKEFLDYRNPSYDTFYSRVKDFPDFILQENKLAEYTEVDPAGLVLTRLHSDPAKAHLNIHPAPWRSALFRVDDPGKDAQGNPLPLDYQGIKTKVDAAFAYLAEHSDTKRFIVRSGGSSGHFQTLVYDPVKNPDKPWTILNSTAAINADNTRLPIVMSSKSPCELLDSHNRRGLVLGIWTQSTSAAADINWQDLTEWNPPPPKQADEAVQQNTQKNGEGNNQDDDKDLPAPIIFPKNTNAPLAPIPEDEELPPPIIFPGQKIVGAQSSPRTVTQNVIRNINPWDFIADPETKKAVQQIDAEITRQLAETKAPELNTAFDRLQALLTAARKRPDLQYQNLKSSITERMAELGLYGDPSPEEIQALKTDLNRLEEYKHEWIRVDVNLDQASIRCQQAINHAIQEGRLTNDRVPDRAGYSGLIRASRAGYNELAKTRGQKPAGWSDTYYQGQLETWAKAVRVGIADVAAQPTWEGSIESYNHAAFIRRCNQLVDNTIVATPEALPTPKPPLEVPPLVRAGIPQVTPPKITTREELFDFIKTLTPTPDANLVHYGSTQELGNRAENVKQDRLFGYQGIVFRGDSRWPTQINRAGGFMSRKDLSSAENKLEAQGLGAGIGATGQSGVSTAKEYWGSVVYMTQGAPDGYIYIIDTRLIPPTEAAYDLQSIVNQNGYEVKDVGAEVNVTAAPMNAVIGWITVPNATTILDDKTQPPAARVLSELTINRVGLNPLYKAP